MRLALIVSDGAVMRSVYPSGREFAAICTPIVPPAPARLSATICTPSPSLMRCATNLATISTPLPGEEATIKRMGRVG